VQSDGTEAAWNDIAGWNENTQPMKWNLLTSNIHNTSTKEMFEYNAGLTLQDFLENCKIHLNRPKSGQLHVL